MENQQDIESKKIISFKVGKGKEDVDGDPTPGPADYSPNIENFTTVYQRAPSWTMTSRHRDYYYRYNSTPGPGAYLVSSAVGKTSAPKYSFGQRHSAKKNLFIVPRLD